MLQTVVSRAFWFIGLALLQVLVFSHVRLLGHAVPMAYVYFLLLLPSDTPRWLYIVLGFALGLVVDVCLCTPGVAAGAMTVCGLAVPFLLRLFAPKDYDETNALVPGRRSMEWGPYLRFATLVVLLHCSVFYLLESFSFINVTDLLLDILGSTVLTLLIVAAFELLRAEK